MNRSAKNVLGMTVAVLTISAAAITSEAQNAKPGDTPAGAPVNIVSPLPLPVTGSTTVSGTVAATQNGTWTVGIAGTPTVNINSSSTTPLIVQPATKAQPAQFGLCTDPRFTARCTTGYRVPTGKRLHIQYVSWRGDALSTEPAAVQLSTVVGGHESIHTIPGERVQDWVGGRNVTIYADPDTMVVYQSDGFITPGPLEISGVLEDAS
jgi:hypothetical protein